MDYKAILGDAYSEAIETALKDSVGKEFVPKDQYNKKVDELSSKTTELTSTTEQMNKLQKDIEGFSKSTETIEELKKQLETTNTEFETFKTDNTKREANRIKIDVLRKSFEGKVNKDAIDLLVKEYDPDDIVLDSKNQVVDFDVKLEAIKTSRPSFIIIENLDGDPPPDGTGRDKIDWSKLSDQEYFDAKMKKE